MNKPLHKTETLPPSWAALEERLHAAEMVAPRAGFARRWQARWRAAGAEAPQVSRAQAVGLLAACGLLTLALFVLLLGDLWPVLAQPGSWLAAGVQYVSKFAVASLAVMNVLASLLVKIPPAFWLVLSTTGLSVLLLAAVLFSNVSSTKETWE